MTRETKIGLLVGLAFIIVFAIILSEKGPSGRSTALPSFTMVDTTKPGGPAVVDQRPLNNAGRLPVDAQLPPIVQPAIGVNPNMPLREEEVVQNTPVGGGDLPPLPESVINLINGNVPPTDAPAVAQAKPDEPVGPPVESTTLAQSAAPTISQPPAPATGDGSAAKTTLASTGADQPTVLPASSQTPFLTIKTVHLVQPGESLGKIAAQHYGSSTPTRVDAIYAANREMLKDRHVVKAGQKLKIPDIGEAGDSFEPAPEFSLDPVSKDSPKLASAADAKQAPPAPEKPKDALVRIPIPIGEKPTADKSAAIVSTADKGGAGRTVQADLKDPPKIPQPTTKTAFRWYEVRKKDTLSGIARRELGSERLYTEIFRLNKDVLDNKNTLKPGMKLRLPQPSAATGEPRTVLTAGSFDDAP